MIKERASRLMRSIDAHLGQPETNWTNMARIDVLCELIQELELAINEAKERTFAPTNP